MAAVLLVFSAALAADRSNHFESVAAGFSMDKPQGWRFVSLAEVKENRRQVQMSDAELQKSVESAGNTPLVAMMKHEESYPGLNPAFQVILRPLPESFAHASPKEILAAILPVVKKGFPDFTLESDLTDIEVSGLKAAEWVAHYTVHTTDGSAFKTRARSVVVPRGKLIFLISMSGPTDGQDEVSREFGTMLKTVVISH